jgi:biotin carboxyl carrier protein
LASTHYQASLEGAEHEVEIEELNAHSYLIRLGEQQFEVDLRKVGPAAFSAIVDGRAFDFEVHRDGDELVVVSRDGLTRVNLTDRAHRTVAHDGARLVSGRAEMKAMMPGRVVNVLVKVGDNVEAGQGVVVIEAMKMENELKAPKTGKVTMVKVRPGQTVEKGDLLMVVE